MPDLRYLPFLLVFLAGAAAASPQPIKRIGPTCPTGYYRQAGYCVPSRGYRQYAVPLYGNRCPLGWYRAGAYCTHSD
jgi:hypothetical protein